MGLEVSKKSVFQTSFGLWSFSRNFFIIRDLQICEKLYDIRFMLFLIIPYKMFLSSLEELVDDSLKLP